MAETRLDVKEAAKVLGISTDAVHKRARRGALESEKDEAGRVFVWLDTQDAGYTEDSQNVQSLLMARLEDENEFLRRELDRRAEELAEMRRIVAGLVQRVPELEAAPETREAPETVSENAGNEVVPDEEERPKTWWRRIFAL